MAKVPLIVLTSGNVVLQESNSATTTNPKQQRRVEAKEFLETTSHDRSF